MMTGMVVMMMAMLPMMIKMVLVKVTMMMTLLVKNLSIFDHHGHVVFFVAVKELSNVAPSEVLLLRLNQNLCSISSRSL